MLVSFFGVFVAGFCCSGAGVPSAAKTARGSRATNATSSRLRIMREASVARLRELRPVALRLERVPEQRAHVVDAGGIEGAVVAVARALQQRVSERELALLPHRRAVIRLVLAGDAERDREPIRGRGAGELGFVIEPKQERKIPE